MKIQKCFAILKECETQRKASDLLSKALKTTLENGNEFRKEFTRKLKDTHEYNCKISQSFEENIEKLKQTELHPCLRSENHKTLMDVYFSEKHMRDWSNECKKNEEILFDRVDKLEQALDSFYQQLIGTNFSPVTDLSESNELITHLENFLHEKEPLILSMLSTLADDLRELHLVLKAENLSELSEERVLVWKEGINAHKELIKLMKEHQSELNGLLTAFIKTKLSNAKSIGKQLSEMQEFIILLRSIISDDIKKSLNDSLTKIRTDFGSLINPGLFPGAYTESLKEIIRRTNVNLLLERQATKMLLIIDKEQAQRQAFVDNYGKILPGDFFSCLKNVQVPVSIKIESAKDMQEIRDPELERSIDMSRFKSELEGQKEVDKEKELEILREENERYKLDYKSQKEALRRELDELQKDFDQQKEENLSIQSSLRMKISEQECALQIRSSDEARLKKQLNGKEERILEMEKEQEKLHKMIQEMTQSFREHLDKKQTELEKKEKEIHSILLDLQNYTLRKKNCAFCGELLEFRGNKDEYLTEINKKLLDKNSEVKGLEAKLEQTIRMMNAAGGSLFTLMANRINDKEFKLRNIKEEYERRLMESEEYLASEQDKYNLLIRRQTETLNERLKEKELEMTDLVKQKEKEGANLTYKIQQLEAKVNYFDKNNKQLTFKNQSLLTNEKVLKQEAEKLKKDVDLKKDMIGQKDLTIKRLNEHKQALLKDCNDAKVALEMKEVEINRHIKEKKNLESTLLGMENKLEAKAKELMELQEEMNKQESKVKAVELKLKAKENEVMRLQDVEDKLKVKEELEQCLLEKELNDMKIKASELELNIQNKSKEIKELVNENTKLKNSITEVVNANKEEVEKLKKDHKSEYKAKEEEMAKLKAELNGEIECLKKVERESRGKIELLQQTTNEATKKDEEIIILKIDLEKANEQLAIKEEQLKSNKKTIQEANRQLESFKEQINEYHKLKQTWESSLRQLNTSKKINAETIHYSVFEKGNRMLFMPHSPGIYVALLLTEITGEEKKGTKSSLSVIKTKINNYVFLDLQSLPMKLQKILMNFSMLVIGVVKDISQHIAEENNAYKLEKGQNYYQCTMQRMENIVGFEAEEPLLTNYQLINM